MRHCDGLCCPWCGVEYRGHFPYYKGREFIKVIDPPYDHPYRGVEEVGVVYRCESCHEDHWFHLPKDLVLALLEVKLLVVKF